MIGIIDSGIDSNHSELSGKINTTLSTSFNSSALIDTRGHGTAVASIIGANWNADTVMAGICQNTTLVSLKVVDSSNNYLVPAIINAINYADTVGIDILNISLEITSISNTSLNNLTTAIANYDGLVVCAAGNSNANNNSNTVYPANINATNVISVGASTSSDIKFNYSNYGINAVHIFAPGDEIMGAAPTQMCIDGTHNDNHVIDGYHLYSGTSIAAPHVSGVAALMLAAHPNMTAAELKTCILDSADACINLKNLCTTGGRLNAYNAVRALSHYNYTDNGSTHSGICSCGKTVSGEIHVYEQVGTVARCKYCSHEIQLQKIDPELEIE